MGEPFGVFRHAVECVTVQDQTLATILCGVDGIARRHKHQ
jgi:hypothetical protein